LTQDSCVFYNYPVLYPTFARIVLATEEGAHIASYLGPQKAALLANHGLLTVSLSVEACVAWFVLLETFSEVELLADASLGGRREEVGRNWGGDEEHVGSVVGGECVY
jgi:ribulose-5-phosphate 4-epimerase/fuculose-1-phosphate aldolase